MSTTLGRVGRADFPVWPKPEVAHTARHSASLQAGLIRSLRLSLYPIELSHEHPFRSAARLFDEIFSARADDLIIQPNKPVDRSRLGKRSEFLILLTGQIEPPHLLEVVDHYYAIAHKDRIRRIALL